jgi:hypothetical protein
MMKTVQIQVSKSLGAKARQLYKEQKGDEAP